MTAATCEFLSYRPPPAPSLRSRQTPVARTAEPANGWLRQSSLLGMVSTFLASSVGTAPMGALALPSAREAVVLPAEGTHVDAVHALFRKLISYLSLPHDWDGYDGVPANPRATLDALEFLQAMPHTLPVPAPMLAGSGEVGLYWDRGERYASIEFEGDGTYTFLTDSPEGYGGAEAIPAGTLSSELRHYLETLPIAG